MVPKAISTHPLYPHLLKAIRIIQFVSALISLVLFSIYLSRLITRIIHAQGAVQGIVAAALAYTIVATVIALFAKVGAFAMKAILIGLDLCFMAGFIAVAVLTRPNGGAARGGCAATRNNNDDGDDNDGDGGVRGPSCGLVTATFALAIVSTILHAASAWMQQSHQSVSKINDPRRN